MTDALKVHCGGEELTEYAAGRLSVERQWAWDRHLVACRGCAAAVTEERRLRSALACAPSMPGDLRSTLLALGSALDAEAPPRPVAAPDPLRLLAPTAPPCHRSPLRATVVAAAAAGVSAAAAWSLTVVPASTGARPGLATATVPAATPASPTRSSVAPVSLTTARSAATVVIGRLGERAESTP